MKTIGITLKNYENFFSNGLKQNAIFLYKLLSKIEDYNVYFIFEKDQENLPEGYKQVIYSVAIEYKFDLILEIDYWIPLKYRRIFWNHGSKIVGIIYGNRYNYDLEATVYNHINEESNITERKGMIHEIWISPHFKYSKDYYKSMYNVPVRVCPYIWGPDFIDEHKDIEYNEEDDKGICIMEPNLNLVKTSLIPILIYEKCNSGKRCYVMSSKKLRDSKYFLSMVGNLKCIKEKRISFEDRIDTPVMFKKYSNRMISYQENCELNYIYLEALYLGIPLIHNSKILENAGYYYEGININEGAVKLEKAITNHDKAEYKKNSDKVLKNFDYNNEKNIKLYNNLVKNVISN